jgi:hypothetical protein
MGFCAAPAGAVNLILHLPGDLEDQHAEARLVLVILAVNVENILTRSELSVDRQVGP